MAGASSKRHRIDSPTLDEEEDFIQRGVEQFKQKIRKLKAEATKRRLERVVVEGEIQRTSDALTRANSQVRTLGKEVTILKGIAGKDKKEAEILVQENTSLRQEIAEIKADKIGVETRFQELEEARDRAYIVQKEIRAEMVSMKPEEGLGNIKVRSGKALADNREHQIQMAKLQAEKEVQKEQIESLNDKVKMHNGLERQVSEILWHEVDFYRNTDQHVTARPFGGEENSRKFKAHMEYIEEQKVREIEHEEYHREKDDTLVYRRSRMVDLQLNSEVLRHYQTLGDKAREAELLRLSRLRNTLWHQQFCSRGQQLPTPEYDEQMAKVVRGYNLLACEGSQLLIPDPPEESSKHQSEPKILID